MHTLFGKTVYKVLRATVDMVSRHEPNSLSSASTFRDECLDKELSLHLLSLISFKFSLLDSSTRSVLLGRINHRATLTTFLISTQNEMFSPSCESEQISEHFLSNASIFQNLDTFSE